MALCLFYSTVGSRSPVPQTYLGRHITPRAAFRQVIRQLWSYLGSTLLWLLVVGITAIVSLVVILVITGSPTSVVIVDILGLTICLPVAIYFGTRFGFFSLIVLVEETSATNALRRSRELVTGAWWRVFGIMSAILLLAVMIELIFLTSSTFIFALSGVAGEVDLVEMIRQMVWEDHRTEGAYHLLHVITTAIGTLTMPIILIGITLLYFDQHIRKEGFDIEMRVINEAV